MTHTNPRPDYVAQEAQRFFQEIGIAHTIARQGLAKDQHLEIWSEGIRVHRWTLRGAGLFLLEGLDHLGGRAVLLRHYTLVKLEFRLSDQKNQPFAELGFHTLFPEAATSGGAKHD